MVQQPNQKGNKFNVDEETGVEEGNGAWSYTSDDLSSNGEYVFTIESETGSMNFD